MKDARSATQPILTGPETRDPNPQGHRHDQSVLSLLAHKMGVPLQPHTFLDYGRDKPGAVIAAYPPEPPDGWS